MGLENLKTNSKERECFLIEEQGVSIIDEELILRAQYFQSGPTERILNENYDGIKFNTMASTFKKLRKE